MKEKILNPGFIFAHILLIALVIMIGLPGEKMVGSPTSFYGAIALIEVFFLWRVLLVSQKPKSTCDIICIVWVFLIAWEVSTTQLNVMHPVLIPAPENVFGVFSSQYATMTGNVVSSIILLFSGFFAALLAGVLLGLFVGWVPRLRSTFFPIAHVLAPIPAVVFSPYLVALMPTFWLASATVIFLGIFWPTLLNMIVTVGNMDQRVINSARMMGLSTGEMLFKILLPCVYPRIISSMKVQLPLSLTMLTFAEMIGATSGMGYYIINYTNYGHYTNVVAGIILVGLVVTVLSFLIGLLERKTVKWK